MEVISKTESVLFFYRFARNANGALLFKLIQCRLRQWSESIPLLCLIILVTIGVQLNKNNQT